MNERVARMRARDERNFARTGITGFATSGVVRSRISLRLSGLQKKRVMAGHDESDTLFLVGSGRSPQHEMPERRGDRF